MSKPIFVIVSLMVFQGNTVSFAQTPQIEQSSKETATGQSKTPWKTKNLPAEKIDCSVETTPKPANSIDNSQSPSINESSAKKAIRLQGHLISANSEAACKNYANCFDFLNKYDKKTALSPESQTKGYLLYANHKWYTLDQHGNDLAVKAIESSIKSKGFYVTVIGNLKGDTITVDSLAEVLDLHETNF